MKQIYIFSFFLFFASCSPRINYLGSTSEPTSRVDVFVDEGAIKKGYDIIGKGYVDARIPGKKVFDKIQTNAIEKAKKTGADAILIRDHVTNNGTSISTTSRTDSAYKGVVTVKNTHVPPIAENNFVVYFLKYTK